MALWARAVQCRLTNRSSLARRIDPGLAFMTGRIKPERERRRDVPPKPALLLRFVLLHRRCCWAWRIGSASFHAPPLPTQRNFRAPEQRYQKWGRRVEELVDHNIPPQGADRRPLPKRSPRLSLAASWIVILALSLGLWVAVFEAVTL
jgi:hypothetical protein